MKIRKSSMTMGRYAIAAMFLLLMQAYTPAQTVTYTAHNESLKQVFTAVKNQTGYGFFYRNDDIARAKPVTLSLNNAPLKEALNRILQNQPLTYTITGKSIIVSYKQPEAPPPPKSSIVPVVHAPIDVTGHIENEDGEAIVATITVKNTKIATSSDKEGNFTLHGVNDNAILVISGVNIKTLEVPLNGRTSIIILVESRMYEIEDVAVSTGYQVLKKSQMTGSFSSANRQEYLLTAPTTGQFTQNLEGRLPGLVLNVTNQSTNGSESGSTPFTIRGVSTYYAIQKPLIILNGYPTEVDLNSLNPHDIESITVLKDAASAAIYGVRASNGVIIINTVKGRRTKPQVTFTGTITFEPKPNYKKLQLLTGRQYIDLKSDQALNDMKNNSISKSILDERGAAYTPVFRITDDLKNGLISQTEANRLFDSLAAYDNTDDYKRLFLQNPISQLYDLKVSGGNDKATYLFGVNYLDSRQMAKYNNNKKINLNYRGSFEVLKNIQLDVQTTYTNIINNNSPIPVYENLIPYQRFLNPDGTAAASILTPYNQDIYGTDGASYGMLNEQRNKANIAFGLKDQYHYPYQETMDNYIKNRSDIFRMQGTLTAKLAPGLNMELGGVYERQNDKNSNYAGANTYATRLLLNYFAIPGTVKNSPPVFQIPVGAVMKTTTSYTNAYTLRGQLSYDKLLNKKHGITGLAGVELRQNVNSSSLSTQMGYDDQTMVTKAAAYPLLINRLYTSSYASRLTPENGYITNQIDFNSYFYNTYLDNRFLSYYANGSYTYNKKYTVSGSIRLDQSNLFGSDPKFRYTPLWSAGISWDVAHEDFLKESKKIDQLRFRFAAGYNGNIVKNTGPFNLLRAGNNSLLPGSPTSYSISSPANNALRWERTLNYNAGLDYSFFGGLVSGTVDFYRKNSMDVFQDIQFDPTLGFSNLQSNNSSNINKGIDFDITTQNINTNTFNWFTRITANVNQNKITFLKDQFDGFFVYTRAGNWNNTVGYPMRSKFSINYLGLDNNGRPLAGGGNGDSVLLGFDASIGQKDIPFSALKYAGVTSPTRSLGLTNGISYKNLSLVVLLMYYGGHIASVTPSIVTEDRPRTDVLGYWKKPGDEATTIIPGFQGAYGSNRDFVNDAYINAYRNIRKMDYVALRYVTLSYSLNDRLTRKWGLSNTMVQLQVQNVGKYVFSGNDVDPENFDYYTGKRGTPIVPGFTFSITTGF